MKSPSARRRKTKLYHVLSELSRQRLHHEVSKSEKDNLGLEAAHALQRQSRRSYHLFKSAKQPTQAFFKALKQFFAAHKRTAYLLVGILGLLVTLLMNLSACTQLVSSTSAALLSTSYTADSTTLAAVSRTYTRYEAELEYQLNHTSTTYPHYDYYHYNIAPIGHNPHQLIAYLTARFDDFTLAEVTPALQSLFQRAYQLHLSEWVEHVSYTTVDSDGQPLHVSYDLNHLYITLVARPLESVILEALEEEEKVLYAIYQETLGNRQDFQNPFTFDWQPYITSHYGWRVHPITQNLTLHHGLDLAVPLGTPVHAIHPGRITHTGFDADGLGHYIVMQDSKGFQSLYGHLSAIYVSSNQEVVAGHPLGAVGSSGASTGSHLHLEIHAPGGELNPYLHLSRTPLAP